MIVVTFYKNGYLIKGHARPDICSELSIFAWTATNIIRNLGERGDYYTSSQDDSDAGYGHFTYNTENPIANQAFGVTKQMLPIWANHYDWVKDGHMKIREKNEKLVIPDNFKELNGIAI